MAFTNNVHSNTNSTCIKFSQYLLSTLLITSFLTLSLHHQTLVTAQGYQPISYAASAILSDGALYLYGGVTKFGIGLSANTGSNQFLRLDLTRDFNTSNPPWTTLPGNLTFTMIDAVPSREGRQFIIGGNRDNNGPLSHVYDIASARWFSTPDLPGLENNMGDYKRGNVGITLNPSNGLVYIYGGFGYRAFSNELSVLNTTSSDPLKITWALSLNQTTIPPLYQPFVHYLPTVKKVLVLGGCPYYDPTSGLVGSCAPLSIAYLISGGSSVSTLSTEIRPLTIGPLSRYQSCRVVLGNGNLFIQGGRDPDHFFSDAWILDVDTWSWSSVNITGPLESLTRAGHSCQLGPNGQIIMVGGFSNIGNTSYYTQPYMAVIDSSTWTFTTSYKGAPLSSVWTTVPLDKPNGSNKSDESGLSTGAKLGIGFGVALAVIALILGFFFFWRKKKNNQQNVNHQPNSNQSSSVTEKADSSNQFISHSNSDIHQLAAINTTPNQNLPNGYGVGTGASPTTLPSHIEQFQDSRQYVAQQNASPGPLHYSESTISTQSSMPSYSGNVAKTFPTNNLNSDLSISNIYSDIPKPGQGATDDAALAAALLRSEELSSSAPSTSNISLQTPILVRTITAPESHVQGVNYMLVPLPPKSASPTFSSSPLSTSPRLPTIHTPVVNTIMTSRSDSRSNPGPQSVPENEAWIERSSPGVKTHIVSARDLDPEGHFPPLTPSRLHGPNSILVGTPASNVTSTASSFSAATSSLRYPIGSDSGYFGPVLGGSGSNSREQRSENAESKSNVGPPIPYRDPRIMKDLDDIAKLIETQTLAEVKNPHAVVTPPSEAEKRAWGLQEK